MWNTGKCLHTFGEKIGNSEDRFENVTIELLSQEGTQTFNTPNDKAS